MQVHTLPSDRQTGTYRSATKNTHNYDPGALPSDGQTGTFRSATKIPHDYDPWALPSDRQTGTFRSATKNTIMALEQDQGWGLVVAIGLHKKQNSTLTLKYSAIPPPSPFLLPWWIVHSTSNLSTLLPTLHPSSDQNLHLFISFDAFSYTNCILIRLSLEKGDWSKLAVLFCIVQFKKQLFLNSCVLWSVIEYSQPFCCRSYHPTPKSQDIRHPKPPFEGTPRETFLPETVTGRTCYCPDSAHTHTPPCNGLLHCWQTRPAVNWKQTNLGVKGHQKSAYPNSIHKQKRNFY